MVEKGSFTRSARAALEVAARATSLRANIRFQKLVCARVRDAHADEYGEPIPWDRRRIVCGDELAMALPPGGGRLADARGVRPRRHPARPAPRGEMTPAAPRRLGVPYAPANALWSVALPAVRAICAVAPKDPCLLPVCFPNPISGEHIVRHSLISH
jgi:hypothetical protein